MTGGSYDQFTDIDTVLFDYDSGFQVQNTAPNTVVVSMNSTFKYWEVNGNNTAGNFLTAVGLDTVNFITGAGISITANAYATPQSLTFTNTAPTQWANTGNNISFTTGNVGIRTTNPLYDLDVLGNINASSGVYINGVLVTSGGGGSSQWTTLAGNIYYIGNVGIGTTLPQYTLDISGSSRTLGSAYANYFITTSDYRIKKDPKPLGNLYSVDNLNPVRYTNMLSNKQDMGFLAHEVQEIYPFLVEGEKDGDTTQSLNYQGLIAVLVKEIQDLKKRVAILEQK